MFIFLTICIECIVYCICSIISMINNVLSGLALIFDDIDTLCTSCWHHCNNTYWTILLGSIAYTADRDSRYVVTFTSFQNVLIKVIDNKYLKSSDCEVVEDGQHDPSVRLCLPVIPHFRSVLSVFVQNGLGGWFLPLPVYRWNLEKTLKK